MNKRIPFKMWEASNSRFLDLNGVYWSFRDVITGHYKHITLCQYVGEDGFEINDKGKEVPIGIYEGDIVKTFYQHRDDNEPCEHTEQIGEVFRLGASWMIEYFPKYHDDVDKYGELDIARIQVIGNIYEDVELIETT